MRIIGNIEHPNLKITVFKMNNRLSVKFETGLYEQTYKFREREDIASFEDIQTIVDETFINDVLDSFPNMHQSKMHAIARNLIDKKGNEFEVII